MSHLTRVYLGQVREALVGPLAIGCERQGFKRYKSRRNHVLGQLVLQKAAQFSNRSGVARSLATTYATSRRSAGLSSRATTTVSRNAGCWPSAVSISPNSMR